MEQKKSKNISEHFENLPKSVKDFVFDGVWMERVEEIAQKYSLNQTQTESLADDTLFVLVGLEKPEDFSQTIVEELKISKLLAEQIIADVENRVFDYALKTVGGKENKKTIDKNQEIMLDTNSDIPEKRPEITPMVEPNEKARDTEPQKTEESKLTKTLPETTNIPQKPKEAEQVQRPISVPRYIGVPVEKEESNQESTPNNNKTNTEPKKPEPVPQPIKKYTVDPYREPLE